MDDFKALSDEATDEIFRSQGVDPDQVRQMQRTDPRELEMAQPVTDMFLEILGGPEGLADTLGGWIGPAGRMLAARARTDLNPAIANITREGAAGFCFALSERWATRFGMGLEDFINSGAEAFDADPGPVPAEEIPYASEEESADILEQLDQGALVDSEPLELQREGPCRICGCEDSHPCMNMDGRPCRPVADPDGGELCSECLHLAMVG